MTETAQEHTPQLVQLGDLTIDLAAYCIRSADGTVIPLTPHERLLLRTLIEADGRVVTKEQLGRLAWGWERGYSANAIWHCVSSLRRKMGDDWLHPRYIKTVRPLGYRLILSPPAASPVQNANAQNAPETPRRRR